MRQSGRTTRVVDDAIQQLFNEKKLIFPKAEYVGTDAFNDYVKENRLSVILDNNYQARFAQTEIYRRFRTRLRNEHKMYVNEKEVNKEFGIELHINDFVI